MLSLAQILAAQAEPKPFSTDDDLRARLARKFPASTMPNTLADGTPMRNAQDESRYNAQFGRSPVKDFFLGGPAEMEPDLLRTQQGEEPQPGQTRRPGALPLTRDAETGWLQMAMPKLADIMGNAVGGPVEAGGTVLGSGPVLRAFHSSPHKFDKFEWSPRTARTGEGAATYGEGLYLAENPAVSGRGGQYWKQFANKNADPSTPEGLALARLQQTGFGLDRTEAANVARREAERWEKMRGGDDLRVASENLPQSDRLQWERQQAEVIRRAEQERAAEALLRDKKQHIGPYTYEVGINAKPEDLLDWNAPIAEQSQKVQELADWVKSYDRPRSDIPLPGPSTGERLYRRLATLKGGKTQASEALRDAGIPGHRFLDQGSRYRFETPGSEPLTRNYVIWDPSILNIDKRYALPVAGGGLGATLASQYQSPQNEREVY